MKRAHIVFSLLRIPLDVLTLSVAFLVARNIRSITDGIPGIYLPIQNIGLTDLIPYMIFGVFLFGVIQGTRGMYRVTIPDGSLSEIGQFMMSAFLWFLIFIGCLYLSLGFISQSELPRLIILFTLILHVFLGTVLRFVLIYTQNTLIKNHRISRERLIIVGEGKPEIDQDDLYRIQRVSLDDISLDETIRNHMVDIIFLSGTLEKNGRTTQIIYLSKIYGVRCIQEFIPGELMHIPREIVEWNGHAVMSFASVTITPEERFIKRLLDIGISSILMILFSPLLLILYVLVKIEDPSGPGIYRNRRVGIHGHTFNLLKFRYMYWKYSVKEAYGKNPQDDEALHFEQTLLEKKNTRSGPVYKIADDPRKTRVGRVIERFSLDELPQLWNVFRGDMSLIGPRAHQPREVEGYEEYQYQVLTVKPGITGMAQVHGRDTNSFRDEVDLDVYYIEHYSLWLDIEIAFRTIFVVIRRGIRGK